MRTLLAGFIRAELEPILKDWDEFAATILNSEDLDKSGLRDHAKGLLLAIANDLDTAQSDVEQEAKAKGLQPKAHSPESPATAHGGDRERAGFSMPEIVSEFRALRASVESQWTHMNPAVTEDLFEQFTRFHEAIDQALAESLEEYRRLKEKDYRLFSALLSASADPIFVINIEFKFDFVNKSAAEVFGMDADAIIGQSIFDFGCAFPWDLKRNIKKAIANQSTFRSKFSHTDESGQDQTFDFTLAPVLDEQKNTVATVCVCRDITQQEIAEERIWHSAHHDDLTGLPNRRLFLDRLRLEVKHAKRSRKPLAVLYMDLDGFKAVNDSCGHEAGDRLLRAVAARLKDCVREEDTVARIGGDEFTVILATVERRDDAELVAQSIINALSISFDIDQRSFHISASVGIALYHEDLISPEELVKAADHAMYEAKRSNSGISYAS